MNLLFVHQNFPGQFKHLAPALAQAGHRVHAFAIGGSDVAGVQVLRYKPARGNSRDTHPYAREFETKVIRGEACAAMAMQLKAKGYAPDVIIANPGRGESLFLKDIWPQARMLALFEFFMRHRAWIMDSMRSCITRILHPMRGCAQKMRTCCWHSKPWTAAGARRIFSATPCRRLIASASR
jgi:hypothetical protein